MINRVITCRNCNTQLDGETNGQPLEPCPNCGSLESHIVLSITETIEFHERIGLKAKQEGFKKPRKELVAGDEKYVAQDRWVYKERVIDREKDKYLEVVKDPKTGEIIHQCEEPLSRHFGHGSAKHKEKEN